MVSINAMGVSGASHEGEKNSVVMQTHDIVSVNAVTINAVLNTAGVVQDNCQSFVFGLQPYLQSITSQFLSAHYLAVNDVGYIYTNRQSLSTKQTTLNQSMYFKDPGRLNSSLSLATAFYKTNQIRAVNYNHTNFIS